MTGFLLALHELMFRFKLFILGVRFYRAANDRFTESVHKTVSSIGYGVNVTFEFFRIPCEDYVLKRGSLSLDNYVSYAIRARFTQGELFQSDTVLPTVINVMNDRIFFFNGHQNGLKVEESRIFDLIADIYVDFLKQSLKLHAF